MIRSLLIAFCLCGLFPAFSQEGLRPLHGRIQAQPQAPKGRTVAANPASQRTQSVAMLQIPFFDDFYYASYSIYPDTNLWMDYSTYVNTGYPIAPPSIGVVTFDGLNAHGYPYRPLSMNLNASDSADFLTSRPIDLHMVSQTTQTLQLTDSLALSFFYQARGNGETPEVDDSLVLEFYKPNQQVWTGVWAVSGNASSNINDTIFHRVFISIGDTVHTGGHIGTGDTAYMQPGFQFRFRNKATTMGDFDHWHVDYVYLDQHRSVTDTIFNDLTIETVPSPFLKNYTAMPYKQFNASEMASNVSVRIRNNGQLPINMTYKNSITNYVTQAKLDSTNGGSNILNSYYGHGLSNYGPHAHPQVTYTFNSSAPLPGYTTYEIKHFVYRSQSASSDFSIPNDTVYQFQNFQDYYALDDGSAEAGYYVNGQGGKMAMKIVVNTKDTLESVQIYFDPVGYGYSSSDTISYGFSINVWPAGDSGPIDQPLYTDAYTRHALYENYNYRPFVDYKLHAPLTLSPGTYYIGIKQKPLAGISVGFDANTDHHTSFYYDSGQGWTQSGFYGSPMIRAVFGSAAAPVGIKENKADNRYFNVYPNPSSGQFLIASEHIENASYQIMNSLGQLLQEDRITQTEQLVNTGNLSDGIYFLVLRNGSTLLQQQKIIVQH